MAPKFSAYPWDHVPRVVEPATESAIARWIAARPATASSALPRLAGGPVRARVVGVGGTRASDPNAAACELRIAGAAIDVRGSSAAVRQLAQRLLGGAPELAAPRPLTAVEHAVWALVVAAAVSDLGIAGDVWPKVDPEPPSGTLTIELAVDFGGTALTVIVYAPRGLVVRAPRMRPPPAWTAHWPIDAVVVVGRCKLPAATMAALAVRDVVTLDRALELALLGGAIGMTASPGAVVAEVATGYVRRDMPLADDAQVELTVALGTTQLTLRQVMELAIGQVVSLGRPLGGPFELRVLDRVIGHGELVEVDGELGVRIVSLQE